MFLARGFVRVDGVPVADTVADLVADKLFHSILIDENGDSLLTAPTPMPETLPSGTVSPFTLRPLEMRSPTLPSGSCTPARRRGHPSDSPRETGLGA
jgi:hypothetical protein